MRLVQTGNIGVGMYREQGFRYIDELSFEELRCTEVNPGDVLICRLADPVGRACLAPDLGVRMITSVDVCILKPSEWFSAEYLVFLLSSKGYLSHVDSLVRGGTRDRISRSMLGAIKVPRPSRLEQQAIADYLRRETGKIDLSITSITTTVERLSGVPGGPHYCCHHRQNRCARIGTEATHCKAGDMMASQANEQAFESTVGSMLIRGGWHSGDLLEWDVERALFPSTRHRLYAGYPA